MLLVRGTGVSRTRPVRSVWLPIPHPRCATDLRTGTGGRQAGASDSERRHHMGQLREESDNSAETLQQEGGF